MSSGQKYFFRRQHTKLGRLTLYATLVTSASGGSTSTRLSAAGSKRSSRLNPMLCAMRAARQVSSASGRACVRLEGARGLYAPGRMLFRIRAADPTAKRALSGVRCSRTWSQRWVERKMSCDKQGVVSEAKLVRVSSRRRRRVPYMHQQR